MRYGRQREPAEIEAEITRVRRDMDDTLSAIERRLTTDRLMEQGLDYLRRSGGREFVSNLGTSVKRNPLSVTLVGIGLAWLMVSGRRGTSEASLYESEAGAGSSGIKERADEALSRVSETASSAKERMSATVRGASEKWGDTRANVGYRARQAMETTRSQARRAREGFDRMRHEQPLALGAIGIAIGAAIAAAIPRTRQEDEWMGDARERMVGQATQAGAEELHKVREAASGASERMSEEISGSQSASPAAP